MTLARDLAAADAYVPDGLTTREALELAALDAAVFRGASEKTLARKLFIVSKTDGSIRPGTGRDMLRGLAKIQGLEHVVEEEGRPATVVCIDCAEVVSVGKTGRVPERCKPCKKKNDAARVKADREANPEKYAARSKTYAKANPDKVVARRKAYAKANKDKVAARKKAHYDANQGKAAARQKAWRDANPDKLVAGKKAYRAKKKAEAAESAAAKPKARAKA